MPINKKTVTSAAAKLSALILAGASFSVHAFTIDSSTAVGDTFGVSWELLAGDTDTSNIPNQTGFDLTGDALFTVQGVSGNEVSFALTLNNTTAAGAANTSLYSFGFDSSTHATVLSWNDSSTTDTDALGAGSNNDPGSDGTGPNQVTAVPTGSVPGLLPGESDEFEFVLKFPDLVDPNSPEVPPTDLNPIIVYDTDNNSPGGSKPGEHLSPQINQTNGVPLPGTLLLLSFGVLIASRRRFKVS